MMKSKHFRFDGRKRAFAKNDIPYTIKNVVEIEIFFSYGKQSTIFFVNHLRTFSKIKDMYCSVYDIM